jgi:hypothetical protein
LSFPRPFLCVIVPEELREDQEISFDSWREEGLPLIDEEIIAKLKEAAREGKIACAMAQKIAVENKIPMKKVGDVLNQMKIKISQCQLGCF